MRSSTTMEGLNFVVTRYEKMFLHIGIMSLEYFIHELPWAGLKMGNKINARERIRK